MIGRGVIGNPWIIKHCVEYLDCGIEPERVTMEERLEMIKKHAELLSEIKPEKVAMHKMRTHAAYYLKGRYRSAEIKPRLFKMNTKKELFDLLDEYVELIK
jgi:tRNA-dihydrouridine synthase